MNEAERKKLRQAIDFIHRDEAEGGDYNKGMDILSDLLMSKRLTKAALKREPSVRKVVESISRRLYDLLGQEQDALRDDDDTGRCASYHRGAINAYMITLAEVGSYFEQKR